jgi:hypothetical protein
VSVVRPMGKGSRYGWCFFSAVVVVVVVVVGVVRYCGRCSAPRLHGSGWGGRAAPNSTHSHVFSPCDSMTSSHLTSSLC